VSTRAASGTVINALAAELPEPLGRVGRPGRVEPDHGLQRPHASRAAARRADGGQHDAREALEAAFDRGVVTGDTVTGVCTAAHAAFARLADVGVDLADVTQALEDEGVAKFVASWRELQQTVAQALLGRVATA